MFDRWETLAEFRIEAQPVFLPPQNAQESDVFLAERFGHELHVLIVRLSHSKNYFDMVTKQYIADVLFNSDQLAGASRRYLLVRAG